MLSSKIKYNLLKEQGSLIPSYEKFMELHEYTKILDLFERRYFEYRLLHIYNLAHSNIGYSTSKYRNIMIPIYIPKNDTGVCTGLIPECKIDIEDHWYKPYNPVHCVAPDCEDDPHHIKMGNEMFTYWCPICKIHTYSTIKCSEYCNDCLIHGSDCVRLENDIVCYAKTCEYDPHHHNPRKKDHSHCIFCDKCHLTNKIFCDICKECFSEPHCINEGCKDIPHHNTNWNQYCTKCCKCFERIDHPHCDSCLDDPHHIDKKYNYIKCKHCNNCHFISLKDYLIVLPIVIIDIISEYASDKGHLEKFLESRKYCEKCGKCEKNTHCYSEDCVLDPHHERICKRENIFCKVCNMCHLKTFTKQCGICKQCVNPDSIDHCFDPKCQFDPHHTLLSIFCDLCNNLKCDHKNHNELTYCKVCKRKHKHWMTQDTCKNTLYFGLLHY